MTNLRQADGRRTRLLLEDRIQRVFRELPGAMIGQEEAVHQVRVAGRRLRVALPLLCRKGRGRRLRHALQVLRELTRAVGAGRDLDVFVGLLEDRLAELPGVDVEQRRLLLRLRAARQRVRSRVAEAVMDLDIDGLRRDLRRLLEKGPADAATVLARLVTLREEQGAILLRGFSRVGDRHLPAALHALRRCARRLRYAAEIEDAVRGEDSRAAVLWKRLQDGIGGLHDHHQLSLWLVEQARLQRARGNRAAAITAGREQRFFVAEARRLHAALLARRPSDLALRALDAMSRARPPARATTEAPAPEPGKEGA